jgi:hypothetical protein
MEIQHLEFENIYKYPSKFLKYFFTEEKVKSKKQTL